MTILHAFLSRLRATAATAATAAAAADPPPPATASTWVAARAPLLATALVLGLLVWALWAVNGVMAKVAHIEGDRLPRLELVQRARYADLAAGIALRNALLLRDEALTRSELEVYEARHQEAEDALARLVSMSQRGQAAPAVQAIVRAHRAMQAVRDEVVAQQLKSPSEPPSDELSRRLQQMLDAYLAPMQGLSQAEGALVDAGIADAFATTQRARWLLALAGVLALAAATLQLLARFRQTRADLARKDLEIARLRQQRDALVREVHHRIKNHLQGLLALIEGDAAGDPVAARRLSTLQGHVLALMNVHGLQAMSGSARDGGISLRELVAAQLPLIEAGFPGVALRLDAADEGALRLDAEQAVPVALVVTELIVNAAKHGAGSAVEVAVHDGGGRAAVTVSNRIAATPGFDWGSGQGLGTGLQLAASLLHGIGRIVQGRGTAGELTMTVELTRPSA